MWRGIGARGAGAALGFALALSSPLAASAQGFLAATRLFEVRQGSARSDLVRAASRGGYELAGGRRVELRDWYGTEWPDLHVSFLTRVDESLGIIWGASTGEGGEKYRIDPGLKLGFVLSVEPAPLTELSLTVTTQLGSNLRERSCRADYGAIGGVQRVNCRLAASTLAPADTLRHRLRVGGLEETRIALGLHIRF